MEMITIPKEEYDRLKSIESSLDQEAIKRWKEGLKDLKAGRVTDL